MKQLHVATIVGTRPEIIRLSCVMRALDAHPAIRHSLLHTGQNYDYTLNQIFFDELSLKAPDFVYDLNTNSLGATLGGILEHTETQLRRLAPDAVLILGDTNSALSAIIAKRLRIPVYHMEAGNRCFDFNVPEEINRRIVDHIADFNLVYTEHARRHLLSEGVPHRRIYLTGSPMKEVLDTYQASINASDVLTRLELRPQGYFLVSVHREENVDNPQSLQEIVSALKGLHKEHNLPVIVSTHPRTRKRLEALSIQPEADGIRFLEPFGFFDYVALQKHSACTLSDSGTISEESAILDFPAVTLRQAMERPEAIDTGGIIMTGLDSAHILRCCVSAMQEARSIPQDYTISNTSQRTIHCILSTATLSNMWHGIRHQPLR